MIGKRVSGVVPIILLLPVTIIAGDFFMIISGDEG
jgi:hypothetical protein